MPMTGRCMSETHHGKIFTGNLTMSKIILWRVVVVWIAGLFSIGAYAEGNVQFSTELPAVVDIEMIESGRNTGPATPVRISKGGPRIEIGPGVSRVIMPPVTSEESEKAIHSQVLPEDLVSAVPAYPDLDQAADMSSLRASGDTAPVGPASIAELARALKNDVDLIYEYVRNNIAYYPTWGIQKGAMGALLDNQGTAFDQAALMVQLLRQAGYTASYIKGRIHLTAAQMQDWFGISTSNVCAVLNLFGQARIPVVPNSVVSSPPTNCSSSSSPGALVSMKFDHVWVKVRIGSTDYHFDPSFKSHTHKNGINLASASGYNANTYLASARSGATITADYVQGINRTNIRNNLTSYANNLATYLRTNLPAGTLDDVIGGKTITPHTGNALRQTSLPYRDTGAVLTEWTSTIPTLTTCLGYVSNIRASTKYTPQNRSTAGGSRLPITARIVRNSSSMAL